VKAVRKVPDPDRMIDERKFCGVVTRLAHTDPFGGRIEFAAAAFERYYLETWASWTLNTTIFRCSL
jgi:hypothetical protein